MGRTLEEWLEVLGDSVSIAASASSCERTVSPHVPRLRKQHNEHLFKHAHRMHCCAVAYTLYRALSRITARHVSALQAALDEESAASLKEDLEAAKQVCQYPGCCTQAVVY